MKGTSLHIKDMWIKQLCSRNIWDFAMALRARKVSGAFEKQAPGRNRDQPLSRWWHFFASQPMGIFRFWRNGEFTFFQRCLQPLYFSRSPPLPSQVFRFALASSSLAILSTSTIKEKYKKIEEYKSKNRHNVGWFFWRCTLFRLAKPAFFRYNENFISGRAGRAWGRVFM